MQHAGVTACLIPRRVGAWVRLGFTVALFVTGVVSQSPEGAAPGFDPTVPKAVPSIPRLNPPKGRRLVSTEEPLHLRDFEHCVSIPRRGGAWFRQDDRSCRNYPHLCLNPPKGRRLVSTRNPPAQADSSDDCLNPPKGRRLVSTQRSSTTPSPRLVSQSPKGRRLVSTHRDDSSTSSEDVSIPRRGGAWFRRPKT